MLCWHLIGKSKLIKSVSKAVFSRLLIILYRTTIIRGRTFDFWKGGYGWFQKKKMSCRLSSREKKSCKEIPEIQWLCMSGERILSPEIWKKKILTWTILAHKNWSEPRNYLNYTNLFERWFESLSIVIGMETFHATREN